MGGKLHLKLNIGEKPIANKYREGKMKRTLKRELKVLEIVKREAMITMLKKKKKIYFFFFSMLYKEFNLNLFF